MIVDTSAIVAILQSEDDAAGLHTRLIEDPDPWMSAATYVETGIVIDAYRSPEFSRRFDELMHACRVRIVEVTSEQARVAREAYRDFGRGSGHAAKLNFGDCFAYALAVTTDEPLLFTGDDFGHTNVRRAL